MEFCINATQTKLLGVNSTACKVKSYSVINEALALKTSRESWSFSLQLP